MKLLAYKAHIHGMEVLLADNVLKQDHNVNGYRFHTLNELLLHK